MRKRPMKVASRFIRTDWPMLLIAVLVIALGLAPEGLRPQLGYLRRAVAGGQWWRLFTCNFVHLGWKHIAFDLTGLALVWAFAREVLAGWRWLAVLAIGSWVIGLALWFLYTNVDWYVGLSGITFTVWVATGVLLCAPLRFEGPMLLAMVGALVGWEQAVGPPPWTVALLHEPTLPAAHLVGAVTGLVIGLWVLGLRQREKKHFENADRPIT